MANDRRDPSAFEYWAFVISGWACLIAIGTAVYEYQVETLQSLRAVQDDVTNETKFMNDYLAAGLRSKP